MIHAGDGMKPIYVKIAEWLEKEILAGNFQADEKVPSQYQLAEMFNINPATAAKGLNILVDEKILYKKRGLGMFVSAQGREILFQKRKNVTLKNMVIDLILAGERVGVDRDQLIMMIKTVKIPKEREGEEL